VAVSTADWIDPSMEVFTIAVTASASTMGSAIPGNYVYDLELNSGSQVTRLIQGGFAIQAEVTK
jgi:hypothetical protein